MVSKKLNTLVGKSVWAAFEQVHVVRGYMAVFFSRSSRGLPRYVRKPSIWLEIKRILKYNSGVAVTNNRLMWQNAATVDANNPLDGSTLMSF